MTILVPEDKAVPVLNKRFAKATKTGPVQGGDR